MSKVFKKEMHRNCWLAWKFKLPFQVKNGKSSKLEYASRLYNLKLKLLKVISLPDFVQNMCIHLSPQHSNNVRKLGYHNYLVPNNSKRWNHNGWFMFSMSFLSSVIHDKYDANRVYITCQNCLVVEWRLTISWWKF